MDELATDLILLAARGDGRLDVPQKLRFGLAGSELVRLAAARAIGASIDAATAAAVSAAQDAGHHGGAAGGHH